MRLAASRIFWWREVADQDGDNRDYRRSSINVNPEATRMDDGH